MSTAMPPHQDCEVETPPVAESIATAVGEEPNGGVSWEKLFRKSRFARVRGRFVVPVILCRGKNICRSGTLSHEAEVLLNTLNEKTRSFWYGQQQSSIARYEYVRGLDCFNLLQPSGIHECRRADIDAKTANSRYRADARVANQVYMRLDGGTSKGQVRPHGFVVRKGRLHGSIFECWVSPHFPSVSRSRIFPAIQG
jgi:hypothetical protein